MPGIAGVFCVSLLMGSRCSFEWKRRNWKTGYLEGLVGFIARGGSSPLSRTF